MHSLKLLSAFFPNHLNLLHAHVWCVYRKHVCSHFYAQIVRNLKSQKSHLRKYIQNSSSEAAFYLHIRTQLLTTVAVRKELGNDSLEFSQGQSATVLSLDCMSTHSLWKHFLSSKKKGKIGNRFSLILPSCLKLSLGHEKNAIKGILSRRRRRRVAWRLSKYHAGWNILRDLFSTILESILG